jgi:hypothetical protein
MTGREIICLALVISVTFLLAWMAWLAMRKEQGR